MIDETKDFILLNSNDPDHHLTTCELHPSLFRLIANCPSSGYHRPYGMHRKEAERILRYLDSTSGGEWNIAFLDLSTHFMDPIKKLLVRLR